MVVRHPFTEIEGNGVRIRTFSVDSDPEEMIWHRDDEDRTVKVLEGDGWYFQRDDELPMKLSVGDVVEIPRRCWHRVIMREKTRLVVEITSQPHKGSNVPTNLPQESGFTNDLNS